MANSKKRCLGCKKYFPSEQMIKSPVGLFHSRECQFEYATKPKNVKKLAEKGRKMQRAETRKRKEELRPLKWYADRAQAEFNKFIRLRDKNLPCVSCGRPNDGIHQRHASHYRSRGACSYLRFDESNVHASCSVCNNHKSGNIEGFTPELIKRCGQDEYERIMQSPKTRKWTKDELIAIWEKYKAKCKELERCQ